ncbi:MAG TPA: PKD domain-containing protein [Aquabacterium sp.]|uniref:PKD domain-containing protein n=1 Tax=Aquabacterium sp. TaxID=1872578 RepID=UPI002E32DCDB|nr:PKD domain-containing protein [Aquabacterium sp.]HEX5354865.1 PKD domain-containing protein [Aquabacterium sp.]
MKFSSCVGVLCALSLTACGGGGSGGSDAGATPAGSGAATVVMPLQLSDPTAPTTVETGTSIQFGGGQCTGGSGVLTVSWSFGDGTKLSNTNAHIYASPGQYSVSVSCTDSGTKQTLSTLPITVTVTPLTPHGFLGRAWSTYQTVDTHNTSIYPLGGLATDGKVYGAWLQNLGSGSGVASGRLDSVTEKAWTLEGLIPFGGTPVTFNNLVSSPRIGPLDLAVSPQGKVLVAWVAGSSLWYALRTPEGGWSLPIQTAVSPSSATIKVAVNDAGDGAIAYCTAGGAQVVKVTRGSMVVSVPQQISARCSSMVGYTGAGLQLARGFDVAIDNASSAIHAVGLMPSPSEVGKSQVVMFRHLPDSGWAAPEPVSAVLPTTSFGSTFSLSYSLAPAGQYAGVAWSQSGDGSLSNAYARLSDGGTWSAITALQTNNSLAYALPLIAVNDDGKAFVAMAMDDKTRLSYFMYVSNYSPAAGWMASPVKANTWGGFAAVDVAIDQFGNGLVTHCDIGVDTVAGTLSAAGGWSGLKAITPLYGNGSFHYQAMRALPDGRAILMTSVYASTGFASSGFVLLQ